MEVLQLELLGGMRISQGSRLLATELSKKAQALLCYLAVTSRPHTREALAGLLWSDFPERRARANLRDALSDLHRSIPHYLAIEQNRIAFIDDPAQVWIDSAILQNHFEQAQQVLRKRPSPVMLPVDLVAQLEEGINLYQGEFLADSLAVLGIRAATHNETADAMQYARECYDTYVQISDRASQAEAHWNFGVLMTWAGQYAQAKDSLTKAEALYGELGLRPPALILGNALAMLGQYEAVVAYVDRYMTAVGVTDKKPNEARAYNWLFYAAMARRDYAEARRLSQKSIAAYEACGLTAYAGIGYCFLGVVSLKLADGAPSCGYLEKGLRILQDKNQLGPLGIWLSAPMTAVLLADAGLLEEAIAAFTFANNHPMIANSVWFCEVMGDVIQTVEADLSPVQVARAHKQGRDAEPWQMGAEFLAIVSAIKGGRIG